MSDCNNNCIPTLPIYQLTSLPSTPDKNTIYFIKNGSNISMYVTDSSGNLYLINESIETPLHNELEGLQGGSNGQYYHLNQQDYQSLLTLINSSQTRLISIGNIIQNNLVITLQDVVWLVNGTEYQVDGQLFNITPATDDYYRTDIIVGNSLGQLILIQGNESTINPVTPTPPPNTALITTINIFGDSSYVPPVINTPTWQEVLEQGRTGYLEGSPITLYQSDGTNLAGLTLNAAGTTQFGGKQLEIFGESINLAVEDGTTVPTVNTNKNIAISVEGIEADTQGNINLTSSGLIRQNGNSFGQNIVIGSNDNFDVILERNNTIALTLGLNSAIFNLNTLQFPTDPAYQTKILAGRILSSVYRQADIDFGLFNSPMAFTKESTDLGNFTGAFSFTSVTNNTSTSIVNTTFGTSAIGNGEAVIIYNAGNVKGFEAQTGDEFTTLNQVNNIIDVEVTDLYGQPNGLATLDTNGKVPLSQINDALLGNVKFKGLYDGINITSSPDPSLVGQPLPAASSSNEGWYFISTDSYTEGGTDYETGDWIISVITEWSKVDNTDAVSSVNGMIGVVDLDYTDVGAAPTVHTHSISDIINLQTTLNNKLTKGGDTDGVNISVGTNDAFSFNLIANGSNRISLPSSSGINILDNATFSSNLSLQTTSQIKTLTGTNIIQLGANTAPMNFIKSNTTGIGFAFTVGGSSTGDVMRYVFGATQLGGVRVDGRTYGSDATVSEDYTTLGQINTTLGSFIRLGDDTVESPTKQSFMNESEYAAITPDINTTYFIEEQVPSKIINIVTSATTYSITYIGKVIYITFNGTSSTFTLPTITGGEGVKIIIINQGSGTVTVNSNSGGNDIWDAGSSVNTKSVTSGLAQAFYNNSINFTTLNA